MSPSRKSFMANTRAAIIASFLVCAATTGLASTTDLTPEQLSFFESKIRPVLVRECYGCHSEQSGNVRGGLRLDTQIRSHIGGNSGPAVVPGDVDASLLLSAMEHQDFEMPPKRKLPQSIIDDFRMWIEMGAPDPRVMEVAHIRSTVSEEDIQRARESFWAYQPPQKPELPDLSDMRWASTPIDQFILEKLEQAELKPAADASASTVLRRLCFDLVGLPPTPQQLADFAKAWEQDADQAVETLVDELLRSPQFGERWGRHWLDVARYAESTGREVNMTYPHAWRYRDFVIDSFNQDKPYDVFVQQQIAGDLLPAATDAIWSENLVATTFLAMGPKNVNEQNRVQFAADLLDEQIDATTRVFLGMSVACARCHDHKFDAIPQSDYYAMAGLFSNITTYFGNPPSEFGNFSPPQRRQQSSLLLLPVHDPNPFDPSYNATELSQLKSDITDTMDSLSQYRRRGGGESSVNSQMMLIATANRLANLSAKLAVVDEDGNPLSYCMGVQERGSPSDMRLLARGEIDQPTQPIQRGFPQVLCATPPNIPSDRSGRLELARWIGSDQNTLAARVMVNRVWQHLVGRGIVATTEDFGVTGQPPSHPELLDYLAVRFVETGWSVKTLIREIATSRFYRMDSSFDQRSHEYDPDNALCWRSNPRRLDAESIRDAMLSVSGQLDLQRPRASEVAKAGYVRVQNGILGDPRESVQRMVSSAFQGMQQQLRDSYSMRRNGRRPGGIPGNGPGRGRPMFANDRESFMAEAARSVTNQLDMEQAVFRSVYLPIVRDELPRSMEVFDFADANSVIGTRESSHTPGQSLYMLNNRFVLRTSDALADRVAQLASTPTAQIETAFQLVYGRSPTATERTAAVRFIRDFTSSAASRDRSESLSALCQGLFASAEFRMID